jgi:hypothetical protein
MGSTSKLTIKAGSAANHIPDVASKGTSKEKVVYAFILSTKKAVSGAFSLPS